MFLIFFKWSNSNQSCPLKCWSKNHCWLILTNLFKSFKGDVYNLPKVTSKQCPIQLMFTSPRCSPLLKTSLAHHPHRKRQLMPELGVGPQIKSNPAGKLTFQHIWFPLTGFATASSKTKNITISNLKISASSKMVDPGKGAESEYEPSKNYPFLLTLDQFYLWHKKWMLIMSKKF